MSDKHEESISSDEVGSMEEVLGENDPLFKEDGIVDLTETTETEAMKENAPDEVPDPEAPIEYLLNPVNKRVFEVNDDLVKRKDLVSCTKEGKRLHDNRRLGRFN
ncbi:MAG: hypothetical protein GY774_10665 [Planctomycetes bacterium]|nr:hypothetical protein [Planctomycetota bacterium]